MESVLGIRRTRLSRYMHKVFVDVRDLDVETPSLASTSNRFNDWTPENITITPTRPDAKQ